MSMAVWDVYIGYFDWKERKALDPNNNLLDYIDFDGWAVYEKYSVIKWEYI